MSEHPIESLMKTAMESIKQMMDVNTVIGDPVETPHGTVIVPVSRVGIGFAAGGGEYPTRTKEGRGQEPGPVLPFGGGSGAGVSVQPVGFLVVDRGQVRFLAVDGITTIDRLIDLTPQVLNQIKAMLGRDEQYQEEIEIIGEE